MKKELTPTTTKKLKPFSERTNAEIYLEFVNDWVTIEAMADNYGRNKATLSNIVANGKIEYENSLQPTTTKGELLQDKITVYKFLSEVADRRCSNYKLLDKCVDNIVKEFGKESKELNDFFDTPLNTAIANAKNLQP